MPENGEKTVTGWKPKHDGCSVICGTACLGGSRKWIEYTVSWTRPPVKGLDRIKTFTVRSEITADDDRTLANLDRCCEEQIAEIVHADSLKLLARGKRSQTADQDRFDLSKRAQNMRKIMYEGETLCPA